MSRTEALILRAASVWTAWIWGTRIVNILQNPDHLKSFKAVHTALAAVSIVFAVAIWMVASRSRRRAGVSS